MVSHFPLLVLLLPHGHNTIGALTVQVHMCMYTGVLSQGGEGVWPQLTAMPATCPASHCPPPTAQSRPGGEGGLGEWVGAHFLLQSSVALHHMHTSTHVPCTYVYIPCVYHQPLTPSSACTVGNTSTHQHCTKPHSQALAMHASTRQGRPGNKHHMSCSACDAHTCCTAHATHTVGQAACSSTTHPQQHCTHSGQWAQLGATIIPWPVVALAQLSCWPACEAWLPAAT